VDSFEGRSGVAGVAQGDDAPLAFLFDQAERYRRFSGRYRKSLKRKSTEHKRLMDATLKRDAATACLLLKEHILGTQHNVEAILRDQAAA